MNISRFEPTTFVSISDFFTTPNLKFQPLILLVNVTNILHLKITNKNSNGNSIYKKVQTPNLH